jgi:SAM-dependent methyltransferase
MNHRERFYPESRFGGFTDIDGTVAFFTRVNALLRPGHTVLDVGCGRGAYDEDPVPLRRGLRILRGKVARVIGIDVDPAAAANPHIDELRLIEGPRWPLENDAVDLIVCDNVLEHVADPAGFFSELRRVLRDGGAVCIRTPNRWSYIALAATLIPDRHHAAVTAAVQESRKEEDVFPTLYRCNSVRRLRAQLRGHGIEAVVYGYEAEPSYLAFSRLAYGLGVLHQRFAPRGIKPALFAFGRLKK